jgi:regulator of RNase E activity RraA
MDASEADAYTLADAARRLGVGGVVTRLKPQTRATQFSGRALTARVRYTPHTPVPLANYGIAELLERVAPGDVLVLDMGGQELTGMGDIVATYLARQGVAGAVINGLIRDAEEIDMTGLPVFSLGVGIGTIAGRGFIEDIGEPVWLDGIRFATGDVVAGCRGGIVCVPPGDEAAVRSVAADIQASDRAVIDALARGEPAAQIWKRHKSLPVEPGSAAAKST